MGKGENMLRIVEQSHDEKIAMYMKLTKRELVEMLINSNKALSYHHTVEAAFPMRRVETIPQPGTIWSNI